MFQQSLETQCAWLQKWRRQLYAPPPRSAQSAVAELERWSAFHCSHEHCVHTHRHSCWAAECIPYRGAYTGLSGTDSKRQAETVWSFYRALANADSFRSILSWAPSRCDICNWLVYTTALFLLRSSSCLACCIMATCCLLAEGTPSEELKCKAEISVLCSSSEIAQFLHSVWVPVDADWYDCLEHQVWSSKHHLIWVQHGGRQQCRMIKQLMKHTMVEILYLHYACCVSILCLPFSWHCQEWVFGILKI